jgi:hypothetical protein
VLKWAVESRASSAEQSGRDAEAKTLQSLKRVRPPDCFDAPSPIRPSGFVWGKHPIDFSGAWHHSIPVFMSKYKILKAVFGKPNRSGFHYFLTSVFHTNHTSVARFDFLGGVMVVSLLMGVVFMMRFLVAH